MNSAPAVLRIPAVAIPTLAHEEEFESEYYPWAVHTPEDSPRCWDVVPNMECFDQQVQAQPMFSYELLQTACPPYFEQMSCSVKSAVFAQQKPAETIASRKAIRKMCEPFFDQMVTAVQQSLQQEQQHQAHQHSQWQLFDQPIANDCFQYETVPNLRLDEESTEANDSCAFASLLSSASSEGEALDNIERKSEASEATSDAERSVMVCRHWKSKGWCRLESKCKFLHPEHKCGVSAPRGTSGSLIGDGAGLPVTSVRRKKRGGKNRASRGQQGALPIEDQSVEGTQS